MHLLDESDQPAQYSEIFDQRGQLYHAAMQTYPDCRSQEFQSVIAEAAIQPGMTIVDVPSGGAYLGSYLREADLIGLETSYAFAQLARERTDKVLLFDEDAFPVTSGCIDRVLSIAGLHHVQRKRDFFAETCRILKPGGRAVFADVAEHSPVRRFLDEFVGRYCETGHSGWYFGDTTCRELVSAGFSINGDRLLDYQWVAADRHSLASFCRTLFGMVLADDATVLEGIGDYLGLQEGAKGASLNWQLHCFSCQPTEEAGGRT